MLSLPRWSSLGLALAGYMFVAGCATVDPRRDYDSAQQRVAAATGQATTLAFDDRESIRSLVAERLNGGLSAEEAVQVALLNNPKIRAAFLRIGMARADVVQAGLLTNPTVGISLRFPDGGGLADLEVSLTQNIADLWMIPARTRATQRDLDRTILETAREATSLANEAKIAYFNAVAAQRSLEIARENLGLIEKLEQISRARLEAGNVGSLDVNVVRGLVLKVQVEERNARLAVATAKRTLAILLGVDAPAEEFVLVDALPQPVATAIDPSKMVDTALESRMDLRAARDAVSAAEARVEAEYAKVFQDVELGFALERNARRAIPGRDVSADTARASIANGQLTAPEIESRGQRRQARSQEIEAILGPTLSLSLPIFDQNRAQIAKATYAVQEADALLESLGRTVSQETREAADRLATAWGVAVMYEQQVLPQARATLELSESSYQAGNTPILNVIDAQRSLLETRQAYVAALHSAANAVVDLERATARPSQVLFGLQPSMAPATSQPASTAQDHN